MSANNHSDHQADQPVPDFTGAELKIRRARTHMLTLNREVDALIARSPIVQKGATPDAEGWITLHSDILQMPRRLGVIVGDFAHNARSALDHAVYELARAHSGQEGRHNAFPVFVGEGRWRADITNRDPKLDPSPVHGLSTDAVERVRGHQPFMTSSKYRYAVKTPLARLHRLSVIDKHRELHVVVLRHSGTEDATVTYDPTRVLGVEVQNYIRAGEPFAKGTRVLRYRTIVPAGMQDRLPPPHVSIGIPLTFGINLGRDEGGTVVPKDLTDMLANVTEIVRDLRRSLL